MPPRRHRHHIPFPRAYRLFLINNLKGQRSPERMQFCFLSVSKGHATKTRELYIAPIFVPLNMYHTTKLSRRDISFTHHSNRETGQHTSANTVYYLAQVEQNVSVYWYIVYILHMAWHAIACPETPQQVCLGLRLRHIVPRQPEFAQKAEHQHRDFSGA